METIIALSIVAVGMIGVVGYTVKRLLDTFQRQSAYIMAHKDPVAYNESLVELDMTNPVEADLAGKTKDKDKEELRELADSIFGTGREITNAEMEKLGITEDDVVSGYNT